MWQIALIYLSMTTISLGSGLINTMVPIAINEAGFSTLAVGIAGTIFAIGLSAACFFAGFLIERIGQIRSLAAFAAMFALSVNLMAIEVNLASWIVLRLIQGFCATSLFIIALGWLNEVSTNEVRGRITTAFYLLYTVGFGVGAYLVNLLYDYPMIIYLLGGSFYLIGLIPVLITRIIAPEIRSHIRVDLRMLWKISPMGFIGAFSSGLIGMSIITMAPSYGLAIGLAAGSAALLVSAYQLGNLFLQFPLGALSDRIDRRYVVILASVLVGGAGIGIYGTDGNAALWVVLIIFAICGGAAESIYSLSSAHANDHAQDGEFSTVASTQLVLWSVAASLGPMMIGQILSQFGSRSFGVYISGFACATVIFVLWRLRMREMPADSDQEQYLMHTHMHAITTPMEMEIPVEEEDSSEDQGRST